MSFEDIRVTVDTYLDGLYEGDTERLRIAFHPSARLQSAPGGQHACLDLEDWLKLVAGRPSPKSRNGGRSRERIVQITIPAPGCAVVTLVCEGVDRLFDDQLSLLLIDGKWRIVNKCFHAAPVA